jgi:hypothetical protein
MQYGIYSYHTHAVVDFMSMIDAADGTHTMCKYVCCHQGHHHLNHVLILEYTACGMPGYIKIHSGNYVQCLCSVIVQSLVSCAHVLCSEFKAKVRNLF